MALDEYGYEGFIFKNKHIAAFSFENLKAAITQA